MAVVAARCCVLDADVHEILGDRGSQALVGGILVHLGAVARSRERYREFGAEGRAGSGLERNDPVGEQDRFIDVVGDEDDGLLFLRPDRLDLGLQLGAGEGVERRQRLVEQQHFGIQRERARDGDALAHAAGELGRLAVGRVRQPDHVDVAPDASDAFGFFLAAEHGIDRERNIALDRQPRQQRIALKHHAALRPGLRHGLAAEEDFAGCPVRSTRPSG